MTQGWRMELPAFPPCCTLLCRHQRLQTSQYWVCVCQRPKKWGVWAPTPPRHVTKRELEMSISSADLKSRVYLKDLLLSRAFFVIMRYLALKMTPPWNARESEGDTSVNSFKGTVLSQCWGFAVPPWNRRVESGMETAGMPLEGFRLTRYCEEWVCNNVAAFCKM